MTTILLIFAARIRLGGSLRMPTTEIVAFFPCCGRKEGIQFTRPALRSSRRASTLRPLNYVTFSLGVQFSLALIKIPKIIHFIFSFPFCPPSSSQRTPTHLPYTSTVPCWFPSAVLPRCPWPCCRWKTLTVRLSGLSSTSFRARATDSWSCSEGKKEMRGEAEGWQVGNWTGTTPSPGRS